MTTDEFGEWTTPATITFQPTDFNAWQSSNVINDLPSNVVRLRFDVPARSAIRSYIRVRGVIYSDSGELALPSSKTYPKSANERLVIIPIPDRFWQLDTWSIGFDIMKQYNKYRSRRDVDSVAYSVHLESLKLPFELRNQSAVENLNRIEQKIDVLIN